MTVHYLVNGRTPCNMPGIPTSWPPNHVWTNDELDKVTCPTCKRWLEEQKMTRFIDGGQPHWERVQKAIQELCEKTPTPDNEHVPYQMAGTAYFLGVAGDQVWMRQDADGIYEARMAIAILGTTNGCNIDDPFNDRFYDNYVRGRATTREKAIELMLKQQHEISESLW